MCVSQIKNKKIVNQRLVLCSYMNNIHLYKKKFTSELMAKEIVDDDHSRGFVVSYCDCL